MEKRSYKDTNEQVSLLGFGCMRFPLKSGDSRDIDESKVQEMVDTAIACGVNYFDTAYLYHEGKSEACIGKALGKHPRGSFNLATKMPPWFLKDKTDLERIFNEQLNNCRVEYFDYYLMHNMTERNLATFEKFDTYEFLREKKKEGKIRKLGFSFHDKISLMRRLLDKYEWDFAQIQLNYLDWEQQDAKGFYEILTEKGIPVIIMEPVRGGVLANLCEPCIEFLKKEDPVASAASWAIRYAATLPNVLTVLSGMSNLEQLQDNIATMNPFIPFKEADYQTIKKVAELYRLNATVPCTSCSYCMPCPSGVDIPQVFDVYNYFKHSKRDFDLMNLYSSVGKDARAHNCTSCGHCTEHCPQGIDIPGWMVKIDKTYRDVAARQPG